ncbi:MAG TPA: cation:dicarboxylase symporter family transporter, partial [Nitrospiraceae bacterium]
MAGGTLLGMVFGQDPYLGGLRNEDLGRVGTFVILLLKTLAIPLIFFAVLDAVLRTNLPLRQGIKLLIICLINVTVAMTIGLTVMNSLKPGLSWSGHIDELFQIVPGSSVTPSMPASDSMHPLTDLLVYIPHSMVRPFSTNNVIGVVLLALVTGLLLRWLRSKMDQHTGTISKLASLVEKGYGLLMKIMGWIIRAIPLAVLGALAYVVGRAGIGVFSLIWIFLAVTLLGLVLHALVYYPLAAWLIGKKTPRQYIGEGADAITTAISCNSSLATVPVTLKVLERMKVSPESARLAACVGTNLNNDGVALYEAMAALFLAQALGFDVPLANQLLIVIASVMAGIGVAG